MNNHIRNEKYKLYVNPFLICNRSGVKIKEEAQKQSFFYANYQTKSSHFLQNRWREKLSSNPFMQMQMRYCSIFPTFSFGKHCTVCNMAPGQQLQQLLNKSRVLRKMFKVLKYCMTPFEKYYYFTITHVTFSQADDGNQPLLLSFTPLTVRSPTSTVA